MAGSSANAHDTKNRTPKHKICANFWRRIRNSSVGRANNSHYTVRHKTQRPLIFEGPSPTKFSMPLRLRFNYSAISYSVSPTTTNILPPSAKTDPRVVSFFISSKYSGENILTISGLASDFASE